jgi:hypothetical protein
LGDGGLLRVCARRLGFCDASGRLAAPAVAADLPAVPYYTKAAAMVAAISGLERLLYWRERRLGRRQNVLGSRLNPSQKPSSKRFFEKQGQFEFSLRSIRFCRRFERRDEPMGCAGIIAAFRSDERYIVTQILILDRIAERLATAGVSN